MNDLTNRVAEWRQRRGLSATALAERVGISRQALSAVENGHSAPSTPVALRLASVLSCSVEDLFALPAPLVRVSADIAAGTRVALGRVADRWVAHGLPATSTEPADGVVVRPGEVETFAELSRLEHTALVAGCAPVLGALAGHLGESSARWLPSTSGASLRALAEGRVHVAGLHLAAQDDPATHERLVREAFPREAVDLVGLVGWREGLAFAPGNPLNLARVEDLARPGLRVGKRPAGSGAAKVLDEALLRVGLSADGLAGHPVGSHFEAATAVLFGRVDTAVVIEPLARAYGLPFLPLSEERFELVIRAADRHHRGVQRLLDQLQASRFVREVRSMGAYDTAAMGSVRRVEVA
ncbi:MAG: helix-turn-helix domain-containing protein [Deltaproteobacteria bacterium]|nr:MAG: helix-turn-helix domain-containing protein [Deltaproteobacteria bacterium]